MSKNSGNLWQLAWVCLHFFPYTHAYTWLAGGFFQVGKTMRSGSMGLI